MPNRRSRIQPANRVHDIEFAAEISTSLIAQVRNLQSLLSERDNDNKSLDSERSKLQVEVDSLRQRLRALDESEHRYKEENWNLETRLQELCSQQREAADREKRLAQALAVANADKTAIQKELDDVKLSHSKLVEEHASIIKHHDIELGTAKRTMAVAEAEQAALQRKVDDLTIQNQELAKAFSMQRARATDWNLGSGASDDFETATDNMTPEHSPPPSPIKGTPRHSILETETVKTSLQHAQRTIQSQRNQLHREKTEKLELRRIIQDLRDDFEKARSDAGGAVSNRRSRKVDSKELKKPPRLLGSFRYSRHEVVMDDAEWEDNPDSSLRHASACAAPAVQNAGLPSRADASDQFETANETSESAYQTANERATETEYFQTGNEDFSGSDDVETETESPSRGFGRMRHPPSLPAGLAARRASRGSLDSTASTSADEADSALMRTPTASLSSQRSRLRLGRGGHLTRSSRQTSEEPSFRSSPVSFASGGTPQPGQSLFAELEHLGGSDDDSGAGTPSCRSIRSVTPGSMRRTVTPPPAVPRLPKVIMVDSGVMTEPVKITTDVFEELPPRPVSMESVINAPLDRPSTAWRGSHAVDMTPSRPLSAISHGEQYEQDLDDKLAQFPVPPTSSPLVKPPPLRLDFSSIQSLSFEPRAEVQTLPTPPALRLTPLAVQHVEPLAEPEIGPPSLSLSSVFAEWTEPVAEPEAARPELTMAPVLAQVLDPVATPLPSLSMSLISAETVEPVVERHAPKQMAAAIIPSLPSLIMSTIKCEDLEPVSEPDILVKPPSFTLSTIRVEQLEPREEPEHAQPQPPLGFSGILAEHIQPVSDPPPVVPSLAMSSIVAEHTHPIIEPRPSPPSLAMSVISYQHVEPVPSALGTPTLSTLGVETIETRTLSPRSPRRDGFILPRDDDPYISEPEQPETPFNDKTLGLALGRGKKGDFVPMIAEDETSQMCQDVPEIETPEWERPFKEISSNSSGRVPRKQRETTSDQGAQTSLTSSAIDKLLSRTAQPGPGHAHHASMSTMGSPDTTGTVRVHRWQETLESPVRVKGADEAILETPFRPGSATSGKGSTHDVPPLPSNHRQLIDAARSGSSRIQVGTMGHPLWPASAMKQQRQQPPRTPVEQRPGSAASARIALTPRFNRGGSANGTAEIYSPSKLTRSRKSSVSSFASELDTRFNIRPGEMGMNPAGFGPDTDPRMIQAITQTMIGEFLWKYTRKPGRGEMSENRHRRYFWVHPYTRTLYWSDRDPSTAGRAELKAKSVPIEAVRVVSDDNPMPPGLHRKSMIIISPGRTIKFTCTTGQRHETWFNSLSYLLLRTDRDGRLEAEEMADKITREDVDEFNPGFERRRTNGNPPEPAPPSLSYHSRTTRNETVEVVSMDIPTLTPSSNNRQPGITRSSTGTLSKISGYWRSGEPKLSGTLSSLRGRASTGQHGDVYEASEVHDSAEDLREMIERQDREADRLENVRACCDGEYGTEADEPGARRQTDRCMCRQT